MAHIITFAPGSKVSTRLFTATAAERDELLARLREHGMEHEYTGRKRKFPERGIAESARARYLINKIYQPREVTCTE